MRYILIVMLVGLIVSSSVKLAMSIIDRMTEQPGAAKLYWNGQLFDGKQ